MTLLCLFFIKYFEIYSLLQSYNSNYNLMFDFLGLVINPFNSSLSFSDIYTSLFSLHKALIFVERSREVVELLLGKGESVELGE